MNQIRLTFTRGWATGLITPMVLLTSTALFADDPPKKPAAPARPAAAVPKAAAPTGAVAAHAPGAAGAAASHLPGAPHPAASGTATRPGTGTSAPGTHVPNGVNSARPVGGPAVGGRTGMGSAAGNHNNAAAGFRSPGRVETGHNGTQFQRDNRGNVRDIHRGDLAVHRGPANSFRSERVRPDGSRMVGFRNGGYVEHSFHYGGRDVYRRNYYYGGRTYSRFYNPYAYHGVYLSVYAPSYYYGPGFYGYAYAPWGAPVAYSWGWAGSPWYGYYGGYFTPYPVYASPSLWLTDYLVAQSLQAAYLQQQAAGNAVPQQQAYNDNSAPAAMSPEVKQQIAEEVRRQIALENSERQNAAPNAMPDPASSGIARMLSDNNSHVFVASAPLNLVSAAGECAITEGDVLQLNGAPAPNANAANAMVLASKGQDCAKGSNVQIAFADLQEMQNHMRETIDQGLGELQKKQGTGGLPAIPPSVNTPPMQAPFAAVAPPPDPTEVTDVNRQVQEANQAEQDALAGALGGPSDTPTAPPAPGASAAPTSTVSMGQTFAEVESIMGKPKSIATLPNKTIYVYEGLKLVFVNGKVSDIQ